MKKKRSPTEIIESTPNPKVEHAYANFAGQELEDITRKEFSTETSGRIDVGKVKSMRGSKDNNTGRMIHTHPSEYKLNRSFEDKLLNWLFLGVWSKDTDVQKLSALHSSGDLNCFLYNSLFRSAPIAVRDPKTGRVEGYNLLVKTKKTPDLSTCETYGQVLLKNIQIKLGLGQVARDIRQYERAYQQSLNSQDPKLAREAYDSLLKKYHLKSKFISAKDYVPNLEETSFEKKSSADLEKKVSAVLSVGGFLGSFIFLSNNLTGNVIANLSQSSENLIGVILFLTGLIGSFIWFRNKK